MVEGYFDVAQALQGGIPNVVVSSGTALTPAQARLLKRFASKVVLSFDPDAAGKGAAVRSSELLVAEGFQGTSRCCRLVSTPIRSSGASGFARSSALRSLTSIPARSGRGRAGRWTKNAGSSRAGCLEVAARIPDAAARDQFADRLAHRARITEEVVRAEIKKAAAKRETAVAVLDRPKVGLDQVKTAEKGLIWALIHDPAAGTAAMAELDTEDLVGLATEPILAQARHPRMAGGLLNRKRFWSV